jgi:hypothetical protein
VSKVLVPLAMNPFFIHLILLFSFPTTFIHAAPNSLGDVTADPNNADLQLHSIAPRSRLFDRQGEGDSCEDRCKKRCKGKRVKDPSNCRRCIPCLFGTKPDPLHVACIKDDQSNEDPERKRKGNCPGDTVLDSKEGPQRPSVNANDLKCIIDDEKDCKPPKVPETRPNGKENDASFKPQCLDADENDKTKCDEKQQYAEISVGPDGKAKKTCRPTRQYENKKKNRWDKLKDKYKKIWEERKEERAKKAEERKARKEKIEEGKKQKQKKADNDRKKRLKSYKCGMATAMVAGQKIAGLIKRKRDLASRGEERQEIESYMDMTACYFDADFVEADEFLEYWPSDVNVDEIGPDVVSSPGWGTH